MFVQQTYFAFPAVPCVFFVKIIQQETTMAYIVLTIVYHGFYSGDVFLFSLLVNFIAYHEFFR